LQGYPLLYTFANETEKQTIMRKILVLLLATFSLCAIADDPNGIVQIDLSVQAIDPEAVGNHTPRSPICPPTVYLDGHTLTFESSHPGYTLQLVDSNDDVVYSVFVPAGTTTVFLPSTYVGDYTLQLLWGDWMFYGWIQL